MQADTIIAGVFKVTQMNPMGMDETQFLEFAAYAESQSTHPIATSIVEAYRQVIDSTRITAYEEIAGHGIKATVDGKQVLIGNKKLMTQAHLESEEVETIGTVIHLAVNGVYAGYMVISDEIKENAKMAVTKLKQQGIKRIVMLTGDHVGVANKVAEELLVDEVYAELLP